jgi:hypothetical protein
MPKMDITVFLARFWGGLFVILGLSSIFAKLLGRVIQYTEEKIITISTGYITLLLGLATVASHNLWVKDWRITITLIGWITLLKGIEKVVRPGRVTKIAQKFELLQKVWGLVILLIGVWFLWKSY